MEGRLGFCIISGLSFMCCVLQDASLQYLRFKKKKKAKRARKVGIVVEKTTFLRKNYDNQRKIAIKRKRVPLESVLKTALLKKEGHAQQVQKQNVGAFLL